jgi:hypothetical protein
MMAKTSENESGHDQNRLMRSYLDENILEDEYRKAAAGISGKKKKTVHISGETSSSTSKNIG